jgi:Protein of unknown function (DUF3618)
MSEAPERIEREIFEIRNRMSSDVADLRKHVEPQVVAEQVKQTARQRLQDALARLKANLKAKRREFFNSLLTSTKRQLSLVREIGEKRDPSPLTTAVRSDPRPLVLLAILLALTLLMARKMTGNRDEHD